MKCAGCWVKSFKRARKYETKGHKSIISPQVVQTLCIFWNTWRRLTSSVSTTALKKKKKRVIESSTRVQDHSSAWWLDAYLFPFPSPFHCPSPFHFSFLLINWFSVTTHSKAEFCTDASKPMWRGKDIQQKIWQAYWMKFLICSSQWCVHTLFGPFEVHQPAHDFNNIHLLLLTWVRNEKMFWKCLALVFF